jgi:hypothetical protein
MLEVDRAFFRRQLPQNVSGNRLQLRKDCRDASKLSNLYSLVSPAWKVSNIWIVYLVV